MSRVVFPEELEIGLRFDIGHQQQKLWRKYTQCPTDGQSISSLREF